MTETQKRVYEEMLPGFTDEQIEALERSTQKAVEVFQEMLQELREGLAEATRRLAEAWAPTLAAFSAAVTRCLTEQKELERCPNRRVVHLAKHAKKARTRKKNLHRAMRIIKKEAKK